MTFNIDNPRGVATTPLRKICLGKSLRRTRVKEKTKTKTKQINKNKNKNKNKTTKKKRLYVSWCIFDSHIWVQIFALKWLFLSKNDHFRVKF